VSEDLHHHARVDPLGQEQRGAGVPQVVEADGGEAGPHQVRLEGADEVARVERPAERVGEDEVPVPPLPARPGQEARLQLPRALRSQLRDEFAGQRQGAAAPAGLRLDKARLVAVDLRLPR
jgi:hypothetical protein